MAKKSEEEKTNVCRVLDQKKVPYHRYCYIELGAETTTSGVEIARLLGEDERRVFKTLVTVGKTKQHYVFMIPVAEELDLKKAADVVGEKSIEMIPQKELLPLTGYVHGGCSPIGMKKAFPTAIHSTARDFETILFSAGKVGYQVEVAPDDLGRIVKLNYADLVKEALPQRRKK